MSAVVMISTLIVSRSLRAVGIVIHAGLAKGGQLYDLDLLEKVSILIGLKCWFVNYLQENGRGGYYEN